MGYYYELFIEFVTLQRFYIGGCQRWVGWAASMCHLEASNILLEVVTVTEILHWWLPSLG